MKKRSQPMYQFLMADYFRTLQWHFRNCHLKVNMKLLANNSIEIRLPIGSNYFALISIGGYISLEFYNIDCATPGLEYIKFVNLTLEDIPTELAEIYEESKSGLYLYPHSPSLDILKTVTFIQKHNAEMLILLEGANMMECDKETVKPF